MFLQIKSATFSILCKGLFAGSAVYSHERETFFFVVEVLEEELLLVLVVDVHHAGAADIMPDWRLFEAEQKYMQLECWMRVCSQAAAGDVC